MSRIAIPTALALLLLAAAGPPFGAAAAAEASSAGIEEQLTSIRDELRRLVVLVEEQAAAQRLGLALHRLELEERAVAELAAELGVLREARHALLEARFAAHESLGRFLADARAETPDPSADEARTIDRSIRELERRIQQLDDELIAAEKRIEELEAELPVRRSSLRTLRARVDQRLGAL